MRGETGILVTLVAILSGLCLAQHAAQAQDQTPTQDSPSWRVSVGGGVISAPKFPGSDSQRTFVLPMVTASYGNFFIGGDPGAGSVGGLGVNLIRETHWRLAAALSADLARRKESDDPRLQGLGDVKNTASAVIGGGYIHDWFSVRGRIATDILNNKQGTLARLDFTGRYRPADRWMVFAGPGVTWANDQYMSTFFGVSADQHANSVNAGVGLPQYDAKGGLNSTRISVGSFYRLAPRWALGGFLSVSKLQGDAVNSPITESRIQRYGGIFLSYRFGNATRFSETGVLQ